MPAARKPAPPQDPLERKREQNIKRREDERKRQVEHALRPWLAPGTDYKRVWLALGGGFRGETWTAENMAHGCCPKTSQGRGSVPPTQHPTKGRDWTYLETRSRIEDT